MRSFLRRLFANKSNVGPCGRQLQLGGQVLRAAGEEGGAAKFDVLIARPGDSRDGEWFLAREVLAAAAPLFEGVQAFADHAYEGPPNIRALTGWHRNLRMEEAGLVSTFTVSDSAAWFKAMADTALRENIEEPFGFSFNLYAEAHLEEMEGRGLVLIIDRIVKVDSVDVVHKGKLGGALLGLAAADSLTKEIGMYEELLAQLKEAAPEAAEKLGNKFTATELFTACKEAGIKLVAVKAEEDGKDGGTGRKAMPGPAAHGDEPKESVEEPARLAAGDTPAGENGKQGKPATQAQVEDIDKRLRAAECRGALERRLTASTLPEAVKEKVLAQFKDRIFETTELDEALKLEASAMEKLTASGALRGYGGTVKVLQAEVDRKRAALDGLWDPIPKVVDGQRGYRFLSEAFQDFTGHKLTPGQFFAESSHYHMAPEDWNGIKRLAASLTTTSWGQAFGDSITRAMLRDFREDRFQNWKKIVSSIVPVKDFRTNRRVRVGGYGDLATVSQQATYPTLTLPTDEEATYAVEKRGGIEDLTWEMIQNDDMGSIQKIPRALARAAVRTLNKFVFDFLSGNAAIYDSDALFHANHGSNTAANALTYANVIAGTKVMEQQTFYGESGVEVSTQADPKFLLHPTELIEEAYDITQSPVKVIAAETSTQPSMIKNLGIEPVRVPEFTDANDWFLVADPTLVDTIEIGFLDDMQEPELFIEDDPNAGSRFNADKARYKIRHVYGGAVVDWRGFYRGAPA